jgi:hypothetical protein
VIPDYFLLCISHVLSEWLDYATEVTYFYILSCRVIMLSSSALSTLCGSTLDLHCILLFSKSFMNVKYLFIYCLPHCVF